MTNTQKHVISKALACFLAFLIFIMSISFAFAAEPVALSESNVSVWPTASGEIYYGQKVSEGISLSGGTVTTDGTSTGVVIPGHFEFLDPDARPSLGVASLKFVPEDTQSYIGFEVEYAWDVMFTINKTTPILVDENNPPIATEVEAGAKLSTSTLSGGQICNPFYPEESAALAGKWKWSKGTTIVNESGYYEARITVTNYNRITQMVYVRIAGEIPETTIVEAPTVPTLTYDGFSKWGDINLEGGKAALKIEGTEVEGTFSVTEVWKDLSVKVGSYEIDVVFTPADPEAALPYSFKIPVTVNKGTVKFVDESGEEIVPEITIDRVLEVGDDLNGYLKPYLNASCSFNYEETEGYGEKIKPGTHEYTVKTIIDDPNYERYSTLTFKIVLNKEKVNAKVKNVVGGKQIYIEGGDTYHLNGNFDVKYFIDGKEAGIIEDVEFNKPFEFVQNESGVYTYEIVYNGTEDDYYDITVITEAEDIKLQHQVKVVGQEPVTYTYGEPVTITPPAHEKPYYVFAGWDVKSGIILPSSEEPVETIDITMPDNDIEIEATYEFSITAFFEYIFSLIVDFFAKIAEFLQLQKVCDFFAGIFAV